MQYEMIISRKIHCYHYVFVNPDNESEKVEQIRFDRLKKRQLDELNKAMYPMYYTGMIETVNECSVTAEQFYAAHLDRERQIRERNIYVDAYEN